MNIYAKFKIGTATLCTCSALFGCATTKPYDYTAFRNSHPRSILVLPPLNKSLNVDATNSVLSQATLPLAESGYYVFPVGMVNQIFRENGLTTPNDIHAVAPAKLQEIFGADAALYMNIEQYGTTYVIVSSNTVVELEAKLVDLKTGNVIWNGTAIASQNSGGDSGNGLAGLLANAIVHQIMAETTEESHAVARIATNILLDAGCSDCILYGPRSPEYLKKP